MPGRAWIACAIVGAVAIVSPALAQDDPWGAPGSAPVSPASSVAVEPTTSAVGRLTDEELAARRLKSQRNRELLSVEQDVAGLKERVFRSKATLQLLRELVIEGATLGSRVSVWHVNKLSGSYTVESVQYFLDGKSIFSRSDTAGGLDGLKDLEIHAQALPPGQHTLQINMALRGNGHGVFSYLRAYSFKVQSSHTFLVEDGKITVLRVRLDEKGGPFASFVDRPTVRFEDVRESLRGD
jgi:hypothetical protein